MEEQPAYPSGGGKSWSEATSPDALVYTYYERCFVFFCMRFHVVGHGRRSVLLVDDSDAAWPKIIRLRIELSI